jgi:hypothetical protein
MLRRVPPYEACGGATPACPAYAEAASRRQAKRRHFGVQARVLPVGELVLWYGMFAPCGRFLGTTGFARGAP